MVREIKKCRDIALAVEVCGALLAIFSYRGLYQQFSSSIEGFRFLSETIFVIMIALVCFTKISIALTKLGADNRVIYLFLYFVLPLLLLMFALGVFALAVSGKGGGEPVPGRTYKVYRLESYSKWMQNKVNDIHIWESYYKKAILNNEWFSGCCEPPQECNFNHTNPDITLIATSANVNYSNDDCNQWDDNLQTLCFDCESCKAGFLEDVTDGWFSVGVLLVVSGVATLIGT
ncbi:Tetraspanin-7, partial [Bienertia sinuspersici]